MPEPTGRVVAQVDVTRPEVPMPSVCQKMKSATIPSQKTGAEIPNSTEAHRKFVRDCPPPQRGHDPDGDPDDEPDDGSAE